MSRIPSNFGKSKIGQPSDSITVSTRTGSMSSASKPSSGLKPPGGGLKPPSNVTKASKMTPASSVKSFSSDSSRSSSPTRRLGLQAPKSVGEIKRPTSSGVKPPTAKSAINKTSNQSVNRKPSNSSLAKPKTKTTQAAATSKMMTPKMPSGPSSTNTSSQRQAGSRLSYGGASTKKSSLPHGSNTDLTGRTQTSSFKKSTTSLSGPDGFEIGDRVITSGNKLGTISYIGKTQFSSGTWIGVTLDEPLGKNDGSVSGVEYFRCLPKYGIFCRPENVEPDRSFVLRPSSRVSSMSSLISGMESIAEETNSDVAVGDRVLVYGKTGTRKQGTLRYLGNTIFASGEWAGVELDDASGKNNGAVSGTR